MKKLNFTTKQIAKIGIVASLYVAISVLLAPISAGPIQFRLSEVLNLLAFFSPIYIVALTLGCFIANLIIDGNVIMVVFGTLGTLLATIGIYKTKSMFLASLWPIINGPIVGFALYWAFGLPLMLSIVSISISQFIIMVFISLPIFMIVSKNKSLIKMMSE